MANNETKHWSLIAERGSYWGIYALVKINQWFGRWLFRLVIWPVVFYFFATGKTARKASMDYLNRVYEASDKAAFNKKPTLLDSLKHFITFAESALDKIDGWSGKLSKLDVNYTNKHLHTELLDKKQGAVFIGSHLGNLEVCRALNHESQTRVNVMVFTHHAIEFNRILKKIDPTMDVNLIQVTEVGAELAIVLKQRLEAGEHVVIAADRTSTSSFGRVTEVPFLGENASISQGPFILASLMDCPVYMMFCFKNDQKTRPFEVIFEAFDRPFTFSRKNRQQMLEIQMTKYVERLSFYSLKYPYQWYNFFDFWHHDDEVTRLNPADKRKEN
jgi:predicted LPLAT superfamily acyltransferase